MASAQPATFSPAFQERLRRVAAEGGMTPTKAVKMFEDYLLNPSNIVRTNCNNEAYIFKIPVEIKNSSNFIDCMSVLKTNLENCGFRENYTTPPYYQMQYSMLPGQFTFIKDAPHRCVFYCQKDGCDIKRMVCDYNDKDCHTLMICLQ